MKIDELSAYLEDELEYPIAHERVIEAIGSVDIEAPDVEQTETVGTIVSTVGQETYDSAEELFNTIIGNVSDEYIGRKFYDDRGSNPAETVSGPKDEENVSF
ncbi:DUF5789 family protein [Halobellus captivus]|uniref:DUF5789 family protein n=1 Tax=Halobellus captivus TaxID=2592614 RepID=UPI0011A20229|nr:hypothetical protein [Halobellus captivus]